MSKFKLGDRVRAYDRERTYTGKIISDSPVECVWIRSEDKSLRLFHVKQLRKLKPKKSAKEFWLTKRNLEEGFDDFDVWQSNPADNNPPCEMGNVIHVREVRRK